MMKKRNLITDRGGFTGWLILVLVLAAVMIVGVFISRTHADKSREAKRVVEYVTQLVSDSTGGAIPKVETEVIKDYGDSVLIAARYRVETTSLEYREGSFLVNISDNSQQVYNISDEYPYDHDFAPAAHRFAAEWGVR